MRILVAGGAGYIGSMLVPALLERDYYVEVLDLLWFGNQLPEEVKVSKRDIISIGEEDVKGFDQIIFIAGLSNDPMAEYSPSLNFIDNASSPTYLAYIAKRVGVKRFIFASSCSVYGYSANELYDESSPAISHYPYGISKIQGEFGCLQLQDANFSVVVLRKGTVCGYSPRMRLDLVVNTMFKSALSEKVITINNPAIWRPVLDIRDAVSAYVRAVEAHSDISGVFNIASGNYTVGEIADYVKEGVGEHLSINTKLNIKNIQDYRNYKVDMEKARNVLSFKPRHDAKDIVKHLVDNMEKFKDMDNPVYYNIQIFKALMEKRALAPAGK